MSEQKAFAEYNALLKSGKLGAADDLISKSIAAGGRAESLYREWVRIASLRNLPKIAKETGATYVDDLRDDGMNLVGYFHDTAIDGYEWRAGFETERGLIRRDRTIKPSGNLYRDRIT